ncbi:MAG: AraC family transcriptional regulator [Bacteroidetes bacterium HGW-Bacteroidetes-7]|nr:MAG: AraC family transcriptional regulator [Bacteroidetes bacterium HGW-Bacteroidetes-7]
MKLYIKNMVCIRCKMIVEEELTKLGIEFLSVELGQAETIKPLDSDQISLLVKALNRSGLELMDDKKSILIEKIRHIVIETVHYSESKLKTNLSDHISDSLDYDYTYLANLFSEVTGTTIEKFYLNHKIERVKELLVYNELTITEIAFLMDYSSVAHLSNQFKKITGLSPSYFKKLRLKRRRLLDMM